MKFLKTEEKIILELEQEVEMAYSQLEAEREGRKSEQDSHKKGNNSWSPKENLKELKKLNP